MDLSGKTVLITGGTGSFGQALTAALLQHPQGPPRRIIVFSRDELKQHNMRQEFPDSVDSPMRYFIGDVRDRDRLYRAFDGVDVVVHAAALKQVPACEYNPLEAIKTNVLGAANVVDAAIDRNVAKVLALSTDKAANPINLYGATKLCGDKLFVAGNSYSGQHQTRFSVVRYGNVVGSRGSVVPLFQSLRSTGILPITDPRMTRFWLTLEQAADFVLRMLDRMQGGEIFVPRIPSMRVVDLATALAPECELQVVGVRPGEKLHEVLVTEDDARHTMSFSDHLAILPDLPELPLTAYRFYAEGQLCEDGYRYASNTNESWLTTEDLRTMVGVGNAPAAPAMGLA